MKTNRKLLFLVPFACLALSGCGEKKSSSEISVEPEDNTVSVYVLSGQSNMEGSTYFDHNQDWLRKAFERLDLDISYFEDDDGKVTSNSSGIDSVLTSYYGYYPYGGSVNPHCSNKESPMDGKFLPTNVGMGNTDDYIGPEIGLSYGLMDYADSDKPIYLIKCAFSGSGFAKNDPNWVLDPTDRSYNATQNLYENKLLPYVQNNLKFIEDEGFTPVIKGFLWHQGESDTGNSNYQTQMSGLVSRFRSDFADYAPDQDGENIGFIDAYIYDGPNSPYGGGDLNINKLKENLANESDMNFVINTSYNHEDGQEKMELAINYQAGDVEGGIDYYHYKTYDCVRLGLAYAQMIIDNDLI